MTTEAKISIAGDFNSEKIELIKALMEEEAIAYQRWLTLYGWEISTAYPEKWYNAQETPYEYLSYEEVYKLYEKSKQI